MLLAYSSSNIIKIRKHYMYIHLLFKMIWENIRVYKKWGNVTPLGLNCLKL
jgi:hypothetical protein